MKFLLVLSLTLAACGTGTSNAEKSLEEMLADHNRALRILGEHYQIDKYRVKRYTAAELEHDRCCGTGQHPFTNAQEDAVKECNHHLHDSGQCDETNNEKSMEMFDCYIQCYGEKTGICTKAGECNNAEMDSAIKRHYPEPEVKEIVGKISPICIEEMSKYANKYPDAKCHSACGMSVMCIVHLVDCYCPKHLQVKSQKCDTFRNEICKRYQG